MAKRRTKKTSVRRAAPRRAASAEAAGPSMIIQLGVVFIIVAAMALAGYVGGLYMK